MIYSVQIKNYKIYHKNTFVQLGTFGNPFSAVIGKNGVGKSTVLESLDTMFNSRGWNLNSKNKKSSAYVSIVFEVNLEFVSQVDRETALVVDRVLKKMPDSFTAQKSTTNEAALKLRSYISEEVGLPTIGILGKQYDPKTGKKIFYAGDLIHDFVISGIMDELHETKEGAEKLYSSYCKSFLDSYSYTYIPVEDGIPELLRVEKDLMKKVLPQDIVSGIIDILDEKRITIHTNKRGKNPKKSTVGLINDDLNVFSKKISQTVKKIDDSYSFKHISSSRNLTARDLADAIIDSFFTSRSFVKDGLPVEKLSSGEKRMALVDIVFSFVREVKKDKFTIMAIDEPENSLHISSGFEQFRKLIRITEDAACQIICTSHWHGFIPIIGNGNIAHIENGSSSFFKTKDFVPGNNKIPTDILLKSGFELASSIIHSIRSERVVWFVCEGGTDKDYLESFLKNSGDYRVVAASNDIAVISLYKQLSMSLKGVNRYLFPGEVICLIDTDADTANKISDLHGFNEIQGVLRFRRLNMINGTLRLSGPGEKKFGVCTIEDSLDPAVVSRVASNLTDIKFSSTDQSFLHINSQVPQVRVDEEGVSDFEGIAVLRKVMFGESLNSIVIGRFKAGFCRKYLAEITSDEESKMLESWEGLLAI